MKTCLYRPITLNIIAYQIFPQLYDIQPSLDSYIEQAHFNGTLLIDNLTDNVKTTYQYVSMIDFASYAGKHIRISNSNQLGNMFVGEWNIEGTPLPEIEMPESIKEHMVLWYDVARQGATNESMAANPILRDFSGNNHNGECIGFDWTSDSGIKQRWSFINTDTDVTHRMYYTTDSNLEILNITGVKESQNMYDLLKGVTVGTELTRTYWCKFDVTGLTDLVSKYPDVQLTFYDGMTSTKRLTEDGTYEYSGQAFIGGGTLSLQYTGDIPVGDGTFNLTIKQYSQSTGALVSDGIDDWVYVPNLPRLTPENGFTVIAQRERLGDSSIYAAFASKASDATETDGAFILERFDSNGDVNNVRVRSFGAVTNITEAADDIIWCTSHKYQGINLTVGDDEDSTELALFKFSCNPTEQYCGKYAMYKFLLFDKDLSEKEIAWVMSYLMDVDFTSSFLEIHTEPATITYQEQNYRYESRLYWYITNYGLDAEYTCDRNYLVDNPRWVPNQEWFSITETGSYLGNGIYFRANVEQNDSKEQRTCTITNGINTIKYDSIDVELPPIQAVPADAKVIVQITQEGNPTPTFKTATEAVAGDAVLYDQTNDHLVIVSSDDVAKCATGYTPVGVVVVPGNHDVYGDGSCGVMSLKVMNQDSPDIGTANTRLMSWGNYDNDIPDLPYFIRTPIGNTLDGIPTGEIMSGYLPSDNFSNIQCLHDTNRFYQIDSSSNQSPSPYLTDGSRNPGYYQTISPSSSNNALSDFNGKGNSETLWGLATAQSNWKTDSTIEDNSGDNYFPAACCCWRYHTDGTQQGDWYLPACGELGYVVASINKIVEVATNLKNIYKDIFINWTNIALWSSTNHQPKYARYNGTNSGQAGIYKKSGSVSAIAFLKVNDSMLQPKPTYNFIDLGLPSGTLWCDRNLGASSPEDAGLYFQWGDTQGYTADQIGSEEGMKYFDLADYKYAVEDPGASDGYAYTKYFTADDKTILDPEDDAAYTMLGDEYRMPTLDDLVELCQNTDIYLVPTEGEEIKGNIAESSIYVLWFKYENDSSDIKGIKFYKKNDRETYLFVPASGFAGSGSVYSVGFIGNLWTSSLNPSSVTSAGNLNFKPDNGYIFYNVRHNGLSIRAIKPGEQTITNAVLTENNEAVLLEDGNPMMLES